MGVPTPVQLLLGTSGIASVEFNHIHERAGGCWRAAHAASSPGTTLGSPLVSPRIAGSRVAHPGSAHCSLSAPDRHTKPVCVAGQLDCGRKPVLNRAATGAYSEDVRAATNFRGAEKSRVWLGCGYFVARWRNGSNQGFHHRARRGQMDC